MGLAVATDVASGIFYDSFERKWLVTDGVKSRHKLYYVGRYIDDILIVHGGTDISRMAFYANIKVVPIHT